MLEAPGLHVFSGFYYYYHYSTNNEYIPKALNPPMCDLHVAQSVVHVQLKPSKERNQRRQKKPTT